MKIKTILFSSFLVLILLLNSRLVQSNSTNAASLNSIVGKWVSKERSEGELGGVYLFGKDGNVIVVYGAIIDYDYKITEQNIVETYSDGTQIKSSYSVNGKILTKKQIYPQNSNSESKIEVKMKKLESSIENSNSVIGIWLYRNENGAWIIQEYKANNKAQVCISLVIEIGKFHLINNELTIELKGKEKISRKIRIDNNCLVLMPYDNRSEEIYIRTNSQ